MPPLTLQRVDYEDAPPLEAFADRTVFQTREWLQYLAQTQRGEPVIAVVKDGPAAVGRFTGLIQRKLGLRILGSPFPGWMTNYMGFNLEPGVSRADALLALERFAFRDLRCVHFEMMDRRLSVEQAQGLGINHYVHSVYEIDLTKSEEELLAAMRGDARRNIREGAKKGVQIEEARDAGFVDDYYAQFEEVFARQKLPPLYSKDRVRALVDNLLPTGHLLLLRAREPEGRCIATALYLGMNDMMSAWGSASFSEYRNKFKPNEGMVWYAMRCWKARGILRYDMGGMEHKRKFGPYEIAVPWVRKSVHPLLEGLRNCARSVLSWKRRLVGSGVKAAEG